MECVDDVSWVSQGVSARPVFADSLSFVMPLCLGFGVYIFILFLVEVFKLMFHVCNVCS